MLPWGHHCPYPWLPCHNTLYHTPAVLLPIESSALPQRAGALTLLQSPSQLPDLFLSVVVSSVSQSEHAAWGPQGDNLAYKSEQCRSRSFQSSRTIPWPHQELLSSWLSQVQEDCQQNYCTEAVMNKCFGSLGEQQLQGQHCGTLLPWEALRRPWNTQPNQPLIWIQGLQSQVIVGESKGVRAASFSTSTHLSVPPKYPKAPLNNCFPTSSIITWEEVTWESSCPSTWKRRARGENAALRVCTPSPSHQPPEPFDKLPIQDSIFSFIFWLSCYKF